MLRDVTGIDSVRSEPVTGATTAARRPESVAGPRRQGAGDRSETASERRLPVGAELLSDNRVRSGSGRHVAGVSQSSSGTTIVDGLVALDRPDR